VQLLNEPAHISEIFEFSGKMISRNDQQFLNISEPNIRSSAQLDKSNLVRLVQPVNEPDRILSISGEKRNSRN
jgi:hypothetical protein